jgi:hypothetical protein
MRILVGVAVGLATAIVASTATAGEAVRISGGSPSERQVVRAVLVKFRSNRITAVTFTPHAHMPGITNGQRMDVSGVNGSVRTHWDEQLFVSAYLRESLTRRAPEPSLIVMNGDRFVPVHGPRHPGRIPPPGPRAPAKVIAAYVSSVKVAAGSAKARVVGVDVMHPGPIGIAWTLRVGDPASFIKHRLGTVLAVFDNQPTGVLQRYLGVQGPTGSVVFEIANYPTGVEWYVAPKLAGCSPIVTSGIGARPSCPAK